MSVCPHGLAGPCPDCRPSSLSPNDGPQAAPFARVRASREGPWVVVERVKPSGAFDWFTWHLTRRGARRAVAAYLRSGKVKGLRP